MTDEERATFRMINHLIDNAPDQPTIWKMDDEPLPNVNADAFCNGCAYPKNYHNVIGRCHYNHGSPFDARPATGNNHADQR